MEKTNEIRFRTTKFYKNILVNNKEIGWFYDFKGDNKLVIDLEELEESGFTLYFRKYPHTIGEIIENGKNK